MRRLCLAFIFPILVVADFDEDLESEIAEGKKIRIYHTYVQTTLNLTQVLITIFIYMKLVCCRNPIS